MANCRPRPAAADAERIGLDGEGPDAGDVAQLAVDLGDDLLLCSGALGPVLQRHDEKGRVGGPATGDGEDVRRLAARHIGHDHRFDLAQLAVGVVEARALGRRYAHQDDAPIFGRRQLLRHLQKGEVGGGGEQAGGDHHEQRIAEAGAQRYGIKAGEPCADPADRSVKHAVLRLVLAPFQEMRGQHRAQRQRDERRDDHRHREHEAELAEQPACLTRQERDRDEHGGQRRGGRDDGEEHFARTDDGGGLRACAHVAAAHDVFEHDDRVVDDHAGGQHQREQRQNVDREPDEIDEGDDADQRDRHGDRRDDRRANVEQEQEDHEDDDGHRQAERDLDFVDGAFDEGRIVAGDAHRDAVRQRAVQSVDLGSDAARDIEGRGTGLAHDPEANARRTVEPELRGRVVRSEADAGDVLDAGSRVQIDVVEFLGRRDIGVGAHDEILRRRGERAGRGIEGGVL